MLATASLGQSWPLPPEIQERELHVCSTATSPGPEGQISPGGGARKGVNFGCTGDCATPFWSCDPLWN